MCRQYEVMEFPELSLVCLEKNAFIRIIIFTQCKQIYTGNDIGGLCDK